MKTIKHLITMDCPRRCPYCINDRISLQKGGRIANTTRGCYEILKGMGYDTLILSGGEPTLCNEFRRYNLLGSLFFKHQSVITANPDALDGSLNDMLLDDIMFSPHTNNMWEVPATYARQPVYAMVMLEEVIGTSSDAQQMVESWAYRLRCLGYAGMTIHETYPDGQIANFLIPTYANFSVRYKPKDVCVRGRMLVNYKLLDGGSIYDK